MVGVDGDEGSRRRLPSWMLGFAQNQKAKKNNTVTSTQVIHDNVVTQKNTCNRLGRKRKHKSVNNNENDDAEEEPTVEDLLSIAKEYVEADAARDELQSLNTRKQLQRAKSLEKDSNSVELSPTHPMTVSSTTGDPAQDMLSLFLGPLLNKPLEQEKKPEFTENGLNKFRKLSQSDAGEGAALMKTKSSLKDKEEISETEKFDSTDDSFLRVLTVLRTEVGIDQTI